MNMTAIKHYLLILTGILGLSAALCTTALSADLEKVKQHIREKNLGWEAGETPHSTLTREEKKMRLGLRDESPEMLKALRDRAAGAPAFTASSAVSLPGTFDWRNNGGNFVSGVRDQGKCGACWAFATAAALESQLLIKNRQSGLDLNLSEQTMISCGDPIDIGDCTGGYTSAASDFLMNTGVPAEACNPYKERIGLCSSACFNWQATAYKLPNWFYVSEPTYIEATDIYTSPTVDQIKAALVAYGPLVTSMMVYDDFSTYYTGGVYRVSSTNQAENPCIGGHAVLIVGYDDPSRSLIVKNSWGTSHGEQGFFRIGYDQLGLQLACGSGKFPVIGRSTIAYDPGDLEPPTVAIFSIPALSRSHTIDITLIAQDNPGGSGVAGYFISENPAPPDAGQQGWQLSAPASYTFAPDVTSGVRTLYAWAKDKAGNVSAAMAANVTLEFMRTVTVAVTGIGTVSPAGPLVVTPGSSVSFGILPGPGRIISIAAAADACPGILAGTRYTIPSVTANCTVTVNFALAGVVTLVTPNGGESLTSGQQYVIRWAAPASSTLFSLWYSVNNGASWIPIRSSIPGAGSFAWTVPPLAVHTATARLLVTAYNSTRMVTGRAVSAAAFAIRAVAPRAPLLKQPWTLTGPVVLSWLDLSANESAFVIQKSSDNGVSFQTVRVAAANTKFWTDSAVTAGRSYQYRVYATNQAGNSAYSNVVTVKR